MIINNKKKLIYFGLKGGQYYIKNNKKYYIKNNKKIKNGGSQQPISRTPSVSLSPSQIYEVEYRECKTIEDLFIIYEEFLDDIETNGNNQDYFKFRYKKEKKDIEDKNSTLFEDKNSTLFENIEIGEGYPRIYRKDGKIKFIQLREFNKDQLLVGCGNNPIWNKIYYEEDEEQLEKLWQRFNKEQNKKKFFNNFTISNESNYNDSFLNRFFTKLKNNENFKLSFINTKEKFLKEARMYNGEMEDDYMHQQIWDHSDYITIDGRIFTNPTIIGLFSKEDILPLPYKLKEISLEGVPIPIDVIEENKILLKEDSKNNIYLLIKNPKHSKVDYYKEIRKREKKFKKNLNRLGIKYNEKDTFDNLKKKYWTFIDEQNKNKLKNKLKKHGIKYNENETLENLNNKYQTFMSKQNKQNNN